MARKRAEDLLARISDEIFTEEEAPKVETESQRRSREKAEARAEQAAQDAARDAERRARGRPRKETPLSRDGLTFTGFYINEQTKEQLRVMAFEQRRAKQDLFREALDLLFKKHGYDMVANLPTHGYGKG